jgi:hypothetical protein
VSCVPATAPLPAILSRRLHRARNKPRLTIFRLLQISASYSTLRDKSVFGQSVNLTKMFHMKHFCLVCTSFRSNPIAYPSAFRDGAGEPFEVVGAFENRDDAALRVFFGDLHEPRRRPGEIRFDKIETAKRIGPMRSEIQQLHGTLMTMDGELPPLSIER